MTTRDKVALENLLIQFQKELLVKCNSQCEECIYMVRYDDSYTSVCPIDFVEKMVRDSLINDIQPIYQTKKTE